MQKVIYLCDHCEQTIGDKKHVSMFFNRHSGIANPTAKSTEPRRGYIRTENEKEFYWGIDHKLEGKFMHFCNGKCVGAFFTSLMKKEKSNVEIY